MGMTKVSQEDTTNAFRLDGYIISVDEVVPLYETVVSFLKLDYVIEAFCPAIKLISKIECYLNKS